MKSLALAMSLVLLASCEPITLKVATADQVTKYVETGKGTVGTPVFSLASGSYGNDTMLSFTVSPAGAAVRYTTDGSEPTSTHGNLYVAPFSVPTGTVKAVGALSGYASSDVATRTYQSFPAGTQDATFGHGGVLAATDYDVSGAYATLLDSEFHAVSTQTNGKIIASGFEYYMGQSELVTRIMADGSYIDGRDVAAPNGFGIVMAAGQSPSGSFYHFPPPSTTSDIVAQVVQPDDSIVVAGTRDGVLLVEKVLADGSALDSSFGSSGVAPEPFSGATVSVVGLARQSDGGLLVAGNTSTSAFVVRYTALGQLDTSWGTSGVASITNGSAGPSLVALLLNPTGQAIVVGRGAKSVFSARFTTAGALDSSWGGNTAKTAYGTGSIQGFTWNGLSGTSDVDAYLGSKVSVTQTTAAAIQSDGKVLFLAQLGSGASPKVVYGRLGTDGQADATYNAQTGGVISLSTSVAPVTTAAMGRSDKLVFMTGDSRLYRMTVDGALDSTFNGSGRNADLMGLGYTLRGLGFTPSGSLLVTGWNYSDQSAGAKRQGLVFRFW